MGDTSIGDPARRRPPWNRRGVKVNLAMNPTDLFLFLLSLQVAAASLFIEGWTFNGIGPAIIASAGGFWQLWMQWLRHRRWLRHRESGFAPGTQHLALAAALGWFLTIVGAGMWLIAAKLAPPTI